MDDREIDEDVNEQLLEEVFETPAGFKVLLRDYVAGPYYSAVEITPELFGKIGGNRGVQWELFNYSRSQAVSGSGRTAHEAHTNIPRCGYVGLPRDYEGFVVNWRATINLHHPVIRAWAAATVCTLVYSGKHYWSTPLITLLEQSPVMEFDFSKDLLLDTDEAKLAFAKRVGVQTIRIQESLSYGVELRCCDPAAMTNLREWLEGTTDPDAYQAMKELSGIADRSDERVAVHVRRAIKEIRNQGRTLTVWVFLDGLWRRPVG